MTMQALRVNSTLQGGKYRIIEKLGQGGFGITYLAENTLLEGKVAIKEFFFKEYCERDDSTSRVTIPTSGNREIVERFKQKFIKEAKTIFRLNHPNIVRILDVFEENGTAYYVMDYIEGESLGDMVKRRGAIPEAEALGYVKDAASALEYIHSKNINHLDIKPSNLVLRHDDGKVLVIDFGVAKQYDAVTSEGTTTTPVGISHGYSPAEQYRKNGVQAFSPQSDVYALAATLFKLLTGNTPPEAMEIQDEGLPVAELQEKQISRPVISAIAMAMKGRHERTQSVELFIANLQKTEDSFNVVENQQKTENIQKKEEARLPSGEDEIEALKDAEAQAMAEARAKVAAARKAREEAERKAREEAERKIREAREKAEAERKAREEAEIARKAHEEAERKAREEAEAKVLAQAKAMIEAERKAREAAEAKAAEAARKAEAERKAREQAELIAHEKAEAERKAREEAERIAREKAEAERKAKAEAERRALDEAKRKVQDARMETDRKAKEEAERKAKEEAERRALEDAKRKVQEARMEAERKAKEEAERRAKTEAERKVNEMDNGKKKGAFSPTPPSFRKDADTVVPPPADETTPPEAMEIQDEGLPVAELQEKQISRPVISAIAMAMKGRSDRTQSVAEFISNLNGDTTVMHSCSTEAGSKRQKSERKAVKNFHIGGVSFDMIWVEGGTFCMGATSEQGNDAYGDEEPVHSVTLSGYYIGKTEVTQALWESVMCSNPSTIQDNDLPVENVSWDDCQEFIRKLNSLTGQNFRLPTEAEWEFACRGGNNSRGYKYSGGNDIDNVAWNTDNSGRKTWLRGISGRRVHHVATKLPNELGIYDMSGNVFEWCSDWYGDYSIHAQTNPKGSDDGVYRILRGGSWGINARSCRSSYRSGGSPSFRSSYLGLRLAL